MSHHPCPIERVDWLNLALFAVAGACVWPIEGPYSPEGYALRLALALFLLLMAAVTLISIGFDSLFGMNVLVYLLSERRPAQAPPTRDYAVPMRDAFARLWDSASGAVNSVADAVKDAMLDWTEDTGERVTEAPLPPLDAGRFVAAMRPRTDEALHQLALAINTAPDTTSLDRTEKEVRRRFENLVVLALAMAERMRTDAAHGLPVGPSTSWAERLRRMQGEDRVGSDQRGSGASVS